LDGGDIRDTSLSDGPRLWNSASDVAVNIGGVGEAAGKTRAAAQQERQSADALAAEAETLRAEVDAFLGGIRAA